MGRVEIGEGDAEAGKRWKEDSKTSIKRCFHCDERMGKNLINKNQKRETHTHTHTHTTQREREKK